MYLESFASRRADFDAILGNRVGSAGVRTSDLTISHLTHLPLDQVIRRDVGERESKETEENDVEMGMSDSRCSADLISDAADADFESGVFSGL